ncbi:MAG: transglycosylase domain-containing protein, partial [Candidatus Colwellbacteria bacterium]
MKMLWPKSKELLDFIPKQLKTDYWIFIVKRRTWLRNTFIGLFLASITTAGMAYYYMFHYTGDLKDGNGNPIDFEKLGRSSFKRSSYVYANNGEMTGRYFEEIRDPIRLKEVPEEIRNGFIAAEDKRFYSHPGIDKWAILRAAIGNELRKFNIKYFRNSGASTINQQAVRLAYADEVPEFRNRDRTLTRKLKEARIAIQLTKKYSRDEILQDFLNRIYFGHGVNGVAEASQRYFGKDIRREKLSLREVAILVSLNKSPSLYCPILHRPAEDNENELAKEIVRLKNARDRYNWVLGRMLDDGYISQEDHNKAHFKEEEPLELGFLTLKPLKNPTYGYGNRLVKELLMSRGYSDEDLSYSGGLRIFTTFDPALQRIASEEFEKHLSLLNTGKKPEDKLNGAFVVIEVKTGNILALSGGNDFNETQYNRAMASRSSGSGFKPFTYA